MQRRHLVAMNQVAMNLRYTTGELVNLHSALCKSRVGSLALVVVHSRGTTIRRRAIETSEPSLYRFLFTARRCFVLVMVDSERLR